MELVLTVAFFYFLPTIIAFRQKHPHRYAICVLSIFLGWTFVGWVIALIWIAIPVRHPGTGDYTFKF